MAVSSFPWKRRILTKSSHHLPSITSTTFHYSKSDSVGYITKNKKQSFTNDKSLHNLSKKHKRKRMMMMDNESTDAGLNDALSGGGEGEGDGEDEELTKKKVPPPLQDDVDSNTKEESEEEEYTEFLPLIIYNEDTNQPDIYTCVGEWPQDLTYTSIDIEFDYEVHFNETVIFEQNNMDLQSLLAGLEGRMLTVAAEGLGLDSSCVPGGRNNNVDHDEDPSSRRRMTTGNKKELMMLRRKTNGRRELQFEDNTTVVELKSTPPDEQDPHVENCEVPLENIPSSSVCFPIKGYMTTTYALGTDESYVSSSIRSAIKKSILDNTLLLENDPSTEFIVALAFVGGRLYEPARDELTNEAGDIAIAAVNDEEDGRGQGKENTDEDVTTGGIFFTLFLALATVLLIIVAIRRIRRRRETMLRRALEKDYDTNDNNNNNVAAVASAGDGEFSTFDDTYLDGAAPPRDAYEYNRDRLEKMNTTNTTTDDERKTVTSDYDDDDDYNNNNTKNHTTNNNDLFLQETSLQKDGSNNNNAMSPSTMNPNTNLMILAKEEEEEEKTTGPYYNILEKCCQFGGENEEVEVSMDTGRHIAD